MKKKDMTNRRLLFMAVILGVMLLITAVIGVVFFYIRLQYTRSIISSGKDNTYKNYYVIIAGNSDDDFWKSVYNGALDEAENSDAYVELMGDDLDSTLTKKELLKIAVHSGVDGIIVEGDDSESTKKMLVDAEKAGIPVVTVADDIIDSARKSYIGVSGYNMGKLYGEQVVECAKSKSPENVDALVLIDETLTGNSQSVIMTAIRETIIDNGLAGKIDLNSKVVSTGRDYAAEEEIRDIFVGGENVPDIIICLSEKNTVRVCQTVVDYNKVGEVEILGYYMSPTINAAIEKNIIKSSIVVDTEQMGRSTVDALNEYKDSGYVSGLFLIDISLVDRDTLSPSAEEGGGEDD